MLNDNNMSVKDGFDLLTAGERDQINQLAPLGWYYLRLQAYADEFAIQWASASSDGCQMYRAALAQGVSDLLEEYRADIVFLEQIVLKEGPVPLSVVLLHVQKYLICMPPIYAMLQTIEKKNIRGCRILDHLARYHSGVPVVMDVVQHMLVRVRNIFLKQCLGWMIYGTLEDQHGEFFIQRRSPSAPGNHQESSKKSTGGTSTFGISNGPTATDDAMLRDFFNEMTGRDVEREVLDRFSALFSHTHSVNTNSGAKSLVGSEAEKAFNWGTTFILKLENLPETHVTPNLASKVLFAGKAVKLLQQVSAQPESISKRDAEVYRYLCGLGVPGSQIRNKRDKSDQNDAFLNGDTVPIERAYVDEPSGTTSQSPLNDDTNDIGMRLLREHTERCGYTPEQVDEFTRGFHLVLRRENMSTEILESLIDDIYSAISQRLWTTLRDRFGFNTFLNMIRNTFLMGKGELFQLLLDGVSAQTHMPVPDTRQANLLLNWKVVRGASSIVGLPEDALSGIFKLRINSYTVHVHATTAYLEAARTGVTKLADEDVCGVVMAGATTIVGSIRNSSKADSGPDKRECAFSMCPAHVPDALGTVSSWFTDNILKPPSYSTNGTAKTGYTEASVSKGFQAWCEAHPQATNAFASTDRAGAAKVAEGALSQAWLRPAQDYRTGALWLSEPKYVAKGFTLKASFACDWALLVGRLTDSHPWLAGTGYPLGHADSTLNGDADDATVSYSVASTMKGASKPAATTRGRAVSRSLLLGSLSACVHSDPRGVGAVGADALGVGIANSVTAGVSFHARRVDNGNGDDSARVQLFLRIFLSTRATPDARRATAGEGSALFANATDTSDVMFGSDLRILSEALISIDDSLHGDFSRCIDSLASLQLQMEYQRVATASTAVNASNTGASISHASTTVHSVMGGQNVYYVLRARVIDASEGSAHINDSLWDVSTTLDLATHVRLQGGEARLGITSSGLLLPDTTGNIAGHNKAQHQKSPSYAASFGTFVTSLHFESKGILAAYPVASPFTISRYPETHLRLEKELQQLRAWLGVQLRVSFPSVFQIIFDAEALAAYQRLFSLLMRSRLVAHLLERLWKSRSHLASNREFCQLRHSMHFFIGNLLYYLQVDVVDSEYAVLSSVVEGATDFQAVLRAHRNFLSSVLRASLVDNVTVQDSIERVLQVCLRFVAASRLLHQQGTAVDNHANGEMLGVEHQRYRLDGSPPQPRRSAVRGGLHSPSSLFYPKGNEQPLQSATATNDASSGTADSTWTAHDAARNNVRLPVVVPPEEIDNIRKDFFTQMSFLFQIMRKVENRGFMFRLDFNNYLSGLAARDIKPK